MNNDLSDTIRVNYDLIREKMSKAAERSSRDVDEIKLIVVSKTQPVEVMNSAFKAGIRVFGENYPEETAEKVGEINGHDEIEWHMIGHLQSRKAKLIADHFHVFHTLDSIKLANKLDKLLAERNRVLPVLIQFNVSGEESKHGIPAWDDTNWKQYIPFVEQIQRLKNLKLIGLMTMPPLLTKADAIRPYFSKLRQLQEYLTKQIPGLTLKELSMGTSHDFEIAIEEGATMIRIGQAILGGRKY